MLLRISLLALLTAASALPADADYLFGFLRTGQSPKPLAPEERQKLQAEHMAHIGSMAESGALVAAGPAVRSPNLRGVFIFRGDSKGKELSAADPYVKAGEMAIDIYPWRATAGIGERYATERKKNPAFQTKMIQVQLVVLKDGDPREVVDRLRGTGMVMAAGPLRDAGALRAVCVIQAGSKEAAERTLASDPDVRAGKVTAEVHQWMVADLVMPAP
jgi:uncharacterized protein YciI